MATLIIILVLIGYFFMGTS